MCPIGTIGTYKAPIDMHGPQQILARCGPGTESAAIVTWVSADDRFVNLRVFPDQGESFVLKGVGFGDDPVNGNFNEMGTEAPITRSNPKPDMPTPKRS